MFWWARGVRNPLDDDEHRFGTALAHYPDGWDNGIFAGCALAALVGALWLLRDRRGPAVPWVAGASIVALLVLMDSSGLMAVGYLPLTVIGSVFGLGEVGLSMLLSAGLLLQWTLLLTVGAWLGLAVSASLGAWLTYGLIRPWGEVFPRWLPGLRGKRVPIRFSVVPGLVVSVMVATAAKDVYQSFGDGPGTFDALTEWPLVALPMLLWPLWAFALAMATVHYGIRRRLGELECRTRVFGP